MIKEFKLDLYRYFGDEKIPLKKKVFKSPVRKYQYYFRKYQSSNSKIVKFYCSTKLNKLKNKTLIQIPKETKIGSGFYIGHLGRIIINPEAVLGKNVNIATGVTIGQESRGKRIGSPTIGDSVWIGTNSVIVGNIKIGNDVLIAPLSFVNFDVPDHSIVIGNPAKIIHRENATEGYLLNKV